MDLDFWKFLLGREKLLSYNWRINGTYRKLDSPGQEETSVKTIGTLLVLDADKEKEKGDNSEEKEDEPKNWLENSTSTCDNQCRSSLNGQVRW